MGLVGLASLESLTSVALSLSAALLGLHWLAKRVRAREGARRSVVLTGQHALHVVELEGERLLIGTGPSGAPRLLARLPAPSEELVDATSGASAGELASAWLQRLRGAEGAPRDRA